MRSKTSVLCTGGILALCIFSSALAGPLEEGQTAYERGDYVSALQIWRPLAEHGNPRAEYMLGLAYALGHGVSRNYAEAAKWYRQAADQGVAVAQANLGALYASGQSVPQDYGEAIKWWRLAAD